MSIMDKYKEWLATASSFDPKQVTKFIEQEDDRNHGFDIAPLINAALRPQSLIPSMLENPKVAVRESSQI